MSKGETMLMKLQYTRQPDAGEMMVFKQLRNGSEIVVDLKKKAFYAFTGGQPAGFTFAETLALAQLAWELETEN